MKGPRPVVFVVGSVIRRDVSIENSYITIAGQTAPEPGITLLGRFLSHPLNDQRLHDVMVRFLRIRPRP